MSKEKKLKANAEEPAAKPEKVKKKKEKKPETEEQRKRKLIIKIIAAVLAMIVAIIAFTKGVTAYFHKDPGFYHVGTNTVEDAMLYAKGMDLTYYFEGESNDIRLELNEVRDEYSKALSHIFKLLDPSVQYEGFVNIAYINAHQGEEIALDPVLYGILKEAYELTLSGEANLFGGALYHEWQSIIVLADPENYDPLVNPDEAERLGLIAEKTADLSNFELDFLNDSEGTVRFTVSDRYKRVIEGYELSSSVLDLGFLKEAFMIEYVAGRLEGAGFNKGYLVSESGAMLAMSGLGNDGVYLVYTVENGLPAQICRIEMKPGSACCTLRAFKLEDASGYYTVDTGSGECYRHPYYELVTANVSDTVLTSCTVDYDGGLVKACTGAYGIITRADKAEAAELVQRLEGEGLLACFVAKAEPAVVCVGAAHLSDLEFVEGRPFTPSPIQ